MRIRPIHLKEADKIVKAWHRHNKEAGNGKFAIAAYDGDQLVGVGIAGRPRSRRLDDGKTLEVYRVCTNGFRNAGSFIYGRLRKIGQLMGYEKFITYTLQSESSATLFAIEARVVAKVEHKRQWNDHGRVKRNYQAVTVQPKFRWEL